MIQRSSSLASKANEPGVSFEELLAERIAAAAARIAEQRIREVFDLTEAPLDPDEVLGPMDSEQAAEFLKLPYNSFRELAPNLPRHRVTPARIVYFRRELLTWLANR